MPSFVEAFLYFINSIPSLLYQRGCRKLHYHALNKLSTNFLCFLMNFIVYENSVCRIPRRLQVRLMGLCVQSIDCVQKGQRLVQNWNIPCCKQYEKAMDIVVRLLISQRKRHQNQNCLLRSYRPVHMSSMFGNEFQKQVYLHQMLRKNLLKVTLCLLCCHRHLQNKKEMLPQRSPMAGS